MNKRLTWNEIKVQYPDQWVSIIEPEITDKEGMKSGVVTAHNEDKKAVAREFVEQMEKGLSFKRHTLAFTGRIPYIVGISKLEIEDV